MFVSGSRRVLVLHGHQFDRFIGTYPTITMLADVVYHFLQAIDRTHRIARFAKSNTKVFLRCVEKIRTEALAYARSRQADIVCCGHTHHAETGAGGGLEYMNSGCWTESPATYLAVKDGRVRLCSFVPSPVKDIAPAIRMPEPLGALLPADVALN